MTGKRKTVGSTKKIKRKKTNPPTGFDLDDCDPFQTSHADTLHKAYCIEREECELLTIKPSVKSWKLTGQVAVMELQWNVVFIQVKNFTLCPAAVLFLSGVTSNSEFKKAMQKRSEKKRNDDRVTSECKLLRQFIQIG